MTPMGNMGHDVALRQPAVRCRLPPCLRHLLDEGLRLRVVELWQERALLNDLRETRPIANWKRVFVARKLRELGRSVLLEDACGFTEGLAVHRK